MTDNMLEKTCKSVEWWTPPEIVEAARGTLGGIIDLDPATHESNPTHADRFFTEKDDGLKQSWELNGDDFTSVWCNPPYGKLFKPFVAKIAEHAARRHPIIACYPFGSRSEQEYWQTDVMHPTLTAICFVRKRVAFISGDGSGKKFGNTYATGIFAYNIDPDIFAENFRQFGVVREMGRRWSQKIKDVGVEVSKDAAV